MNKDAKIGIEPIAGGATAAGGFLAVGRACGVRYEGRLDLGLLFSEEARTTGAGVFTQSVLRAAPIAVTREALADGGVRAVVVNSGVANAATGRRGLADAREMQAVAASALGVGPGLVAVASTGVIGEYLPMGRVGTGIREAATGLGPDGGPFAEAILTTDTRKKEAAVRVEVGEREVVVGGVAKGSGMIHPNMATMLAFLTTDAAVEREALNEALRSAVERSFDRITVDGDTSPNDMALLMANGSAGNEPLTLESPEYGAFAAAVEAVAVSLAKEIARDGEGATKLIEVVVGGARSEAEAARLARTVAGSSLVKAAVFGEDANWGRVLTAMGYAGVPFDAEGVEISFGSDSETVPVFAGGEPVEHDAAEANAAFAKSEVRITARLSEGSASATAWGCDLTHGYVEINGSYRT